MAIAFVHKLIEHRSYKDLKVKEYKNYKASSIAKLFNYKIVAVDYKKNGC